MAKEVTKPPTGLKITRTGNKFTASWKIGDKDYGDSQHFQYLINDTGKDSWLPKKKTEIGHKTTSKLITTIDKKDYYPNVDKKGNNKPFLYTIGFRVKGNRKKYTTGSGKKKKNHNPSASAWVSKDFVLNPPKKPTLTVELDEELTNVCKFSWSAPYASDDSYVFTDVQWQTILVKNSSETDGSKLNWKNAEGGSGGAESSKTITEDTEILYKDGNSYTRWFRVRSRGPRGVYNDDKSYGWVYKKHVYAIPHQTSITGTSASETEEGGFQCVVDWTVGQSGGQNPIDKTTAQYTITIPDEGLTCPSGVSWNDANISRDTGAGDAAVFSIDDQLGKDQCLFIRVNTQHDSNITYGKPQLSAVGFLKDPSGLSVSTDNVTHKAIIRATNNSDVEDSILIVRYVPSIGDPIDISVIPHDSSSVTVQCPNWDDQEAIAFDVYAIVGTAVKQQRDDGVDSYSVTVRMRSQNTVSQGGSVPVAPKSVSVNRVEGKADTVRVDWDWPWSDAGSAEISWSDHDDAWESTDEPESFLISNLHASHWNISGLETGKTWYIRVRLIAGNMDNSEDVTYGPWSDISQGTIDLSSAPNKPVLLLSNSVIPEDGSTIASWVYTTTDNTAQAYAEVAIVENNEYIPIAHSLTAQHVTIPAQSENYTLSTGNIYNLVCRVKSASGKLSEWSEIVSLTVAEPIACEIVQTSLVHEHIETNPREFGPDDSLTFETEIEEDFTKLKINLEPIQDLSHGAPSPSNICPISGWDEVETVVSGVNQWDEEWETYGANRQIKSKTAIPLVEGATYYAKTSIALTLYFKETADGATVSSASVNNGTFTVPTGCHYAMLYTGTGYGTTYKHDISINIPSTNHDYHPYMEPTTITTDLPQTVYGGTLDVVSGRLVVTHKMIDFPTTGWVSQDIYTNTKIMSVTISDMTSVGGTNVADILSDQYPTIASFEDVVHIMHRWRDLYVFADKTQTPDVSTWQNYLSQLENKPKLFYPLETPLTYQLTPQEIRTLLGRNNVWSEQGNLKIRIAESVRDVDTLTKMPLSIEVTGAGDGGITTIIVERAEDYPMVRPDETNFNGNKGEMVLQTSPPLVGTNQASFDTKDLIGPMDDGATYNIVATVQDGLGQKDSAILPFEVHWAHQAEEPSAEIEIYEEELIAIIKPIAPANADPEDVADIYRLSADKPELIVEGATFGETYVDPYPALGDMGGYRIVTRTKNGDYITEENQIAMVDSPELGVNPIENEDLLNIIDFEGRQIRFYWATNYSNTWAKDFQETDYLGGSIEGDWNPAVSRSGTLSSKAITVLDQEMLKDVRRLADYPGICHVRTADGSSYAADVQVSEDYTDDEKGMVTNYSLSITKVSSQGFDGMTKEQWDEENPSEEEEES